MFICGGAFDGLEKIISKRNNTTSIGFESNVVSKEQKRVGEIFANVETEDLLKFGLIPEFVGRLPVLATLNDLDEEALVKILTEPKNALVKQYKKLFQMEGAVLNFEEKALKLIAQQALERKTGARGLRSIMEKILLETMYILPSCENVSEVIVNESVVKGLSSPQINYAPDEVLQKDVAVN